LEVSGAVARVSKQNTNFLKTVMAIIKESRV
jgi:hypothetical protein